MSAQLFLDCFQALRNGVDRPFLGPAACSKFHGSSASGLRDGIFGADWFHSTPCLVWRKVYLSLLLEPRHAWGKCTHELDADGNAW